jgi:large repetitive protein
VLDANVTGTAEANSTIAFSFNGGPTAGTTVADGLGAWTYTLTPADLAAIGEGANKTVTATATDTVGNTSVASGPFIFGVDTVPPTIAISAISTDDILNALEAGSSLSISGTTNGVQNGRTVSVVLDGATYTTTVTNNAWTATVGAGNLAPGALTDGVYTVTAYATDLAGNQATPGTRELTVDQTAPAMSSVATSGPDITAGDGILNAGHVVTLTAAFSEAVTWCDGDLRKRLRHLCPDVHLHRRGRAERGGSGGDGVQRQRGNGA